MAHTAPVGHGRKLGLGRVPECRTYEEVLRTHWLDADSVAEQAGAELPSRP